MKIKRRGTKDVVRERDLKIAYDYSKGKSLKEIKHKYGFRSSQTVYNALNRVETRYSVTSLMEEEND